MCIDYGKRHLVRCVFRRYRQILHEFGDIYLRSLGISGHIRISDAKFRCYLCPLRSDVNELQHLRKPFDKKVFIKVGYHQTLDLSWCAEGHLLGYRISQRIHDAFSLRIEFRIVTV